MKWTVKKISSHRVRSTLTPEPTFERIKPRLSPQVPQKEGWIDQLKYGFSQETPNDWMPAAYQPLYQHTVEKK